MPNSKRGCCPKAATASSLRKRPRSVQSAVCRIRILFGVRLRSFSEAESAGFYSVESGTRIADSTMLPKPRHPQSSRVPHQNAVAKEYWTDSELRSPALPLGHGSNRSASGRITVIRIPFVITIPHQAQHSFIAELNFEKQLTLARFLGLFIRVSVDKSGRLPRIYEYRNDNKDGVFPPLGCDLFGRRVG